MQRKLILGIGHPRTGTGYTANLVSSWGLEVGHEIMLRDGIVSWQFATNSDDELFFMDKNLRCSDYEFETIIYNVRDPFYSIPSIAYAEVSSIQYRKNFIHIDTTADSNILSQAIDSLINWDSLISKRNIDIIFRIENQQKYLFDKLQQKYPHLTWNDCWLGKKWNIRPHDNIYSLSDLTKKTPTYKLEKINNYCIRYGYKKIFNTKTKKIIR